MSDNLWNLDEITRNDMRELLATLRQYAGYVLVDLDTFKGFGACVGKDGGVGLAMARLEVEATEEDKRKALIKGFEGQAERGEIRAAGYCEVGRGQTPEATEEEDLLMIHICCASGVCAQITMAFEMEGGEVSFGPSFIHRTEPWLLWGDAG